MNQLNNLVAKAIPFGCQFRLLRSASRAAYMGLVGAFILGVSSNASELETVHPMILIDTSLGPITVELDATKAPISTANFLRLVSEGHYNGLIFHRVIADFVIQTGGYDPEMKERDVPHTIVNEAGNGLSNVRGSLGMARTEDPDSASAQFYINLKDNLRLDKTAESAGYAVFGNVTEGMNIVDAIGGVPTHDTNGMHDVPEEPIVVFSAVELKTEIKTDDAE